jgi:hypothetical protein
MVPIWYNGFVKLARFFRLPAVALAEEGALRPMGARRAVLLTPSESIHPSQLLSCQHIAPITPLESALVEVFILKSLKFFRINTYEKHRGWGLLLLSTHPMRMRILSERSESKDLSSHPLKGVCPERPSGVKDLSSSARRHVYPERRELLSRPLLTSLLLCLAPLQSLGFRQGAE